MKLEHLEVLHHSFTSQTTPLTFDSRDTFTLTTCQRKIWVRFSSSVDTQRTETLGLDRYTGSDAYRFLLQVITGLESQIKGETDIFGQFKEGWKVFCLNAESSTDFIQAFAPWIQKLFEDAKEIRTQHLQNVGGDSYGSLSRKLLKEYGNSVKNGPILLVGAGQIAKAIAPWLIGQAEEIWLWNRSPEALDELYFELVQKPGLKVRALRTPEEEKEGWQKASHAIVCIPEDQAQDARRIENWTAGNRNSGQPRALIHLGGESKNLPQWRQLPHFHALDELFALQRKQDDLRNHKIELALKACLEKAQLRSLGVASGGSTHLPHGWEDLALFA